MARAIVLGSGTSTGVPMVGKTYPPEFLADPRNHRTRPSLLLEGPSGNVLVDAGPDLRQQLLANNVRQVDAVLITHTHADHIMGLDDLRPLCAQRGGHMPVYTSPYYQDDIRRVFSYAFKEFGPMIFVPRFDLRDAPSQLSLCGLEIEIFWVEHGPHPVMALRVGDFAYVTDVSFIPPEAMAKLHGLDVLILDAVRLAPHPNHFHLDRALEAAAEIGAKTTWFTHLSDDFDHGRDEGSLPPSIRFAYDGLSFELPDVGT